MEDNNLQSTVLKGCFMLMCVGAFYFATRQAIKDQAEIVIESNNALMCAVEQLALEKRYECNYYSRTPIYPSSEVVLDINNVIDVNRAINYISTNRNKIYLSLLISGSICYCTNYFLKLTMLQSALLMTNLSTAMFFYY